MIVSDIFGGIGGGFKLDFYNNINQYISHMLLMTIFGLWCCGFGPCLQD